MALQPFTNEQLNYFKFASIVLDEFPKALRQSFIRWWNNNLRHLRGHRVWDDSPVVRNLLLAAEGGATKIPTNTFINDWDCTALFQATIFARSFALPDSAGHRRSLYDLYVKPRGLPRDMFHPSVSRGGNMAETFALAIDQLRRLRNKLCHSARSKIDTVTFHQYVQRAKEAFTALGVNTAFIDAIGSLTELDFPSARVKQLEENRRTEVQAFIRFLEEDVTNEIGAMRMDFNESSQERQEESRELRRELAEVKESIGEFRKEMRRSSSDLLALMRKEENDEDSDDLEFGVTAVDPSSVRVQPRRTGNPSDTSHWIQMQMPCPVTGCPNQHNRNLNWVCSNDQTTMYINEQGRLRCNGSPVHEAKVIDFKFDCGDRSGPHRITHHKEADYEGFNHALSIAVAISSLGVVSGYWIAKLMDEVARQYATG